MKREWRPSDRMVRLDITVTVALMHEPSVASVTWAFRKKAGRRIRTLSAAAGSQAQGFPGRHLVSEACLPLGPLHLARARPLQGLSLVPRVAYKLSAHRPPATT